MSSNDDLRWVGPRLWLAILVIWPSSSFSVAQEVTPAATVPAVTPATTQQTPSATPPATSPVPAESVKKAIASRPAIIPYGEQRYVISISLGIDPDSGIPEREIPQLMEAIRHQIESRIGTWWKMDISRAVAGEPLNRPMLEFRTAPAWNTAMEPSPAEKAFALTIDRSGTAYRVSGVEWDRSSQSVTSIRDRSTYDRRILASLATELVLQLFRPLASIDTVTETKVEMRIRGGELLPPDMSLTPFMVGDHVTAILRHLGKNRELKRLQSIPWTTIRIDSIERSYMQGTLISAFKSPLAGSRRRMEMLAVKVRPAHSQTRIQVIPRGKPQSPMAGYRVEVLDRPETKDDKVTDRVTLRTDRNGYVDIPVDPVKPLRYLIVYSGVAPLAKAPIIPGHAERVVLDAPDDAPRLNVEAETELLQSELVDIVARREVLMARARGNSKKSEWEQVDELVQQVDALPTLEQFQVRIEALKTPAIQTAKRSKDKAQESRIARMCKQISDMAILHLDPTKVKEFKVEMDEAKKSE